MRTVLFATGNERKIHEARTTLASYDIVIEPVKVEINEIQHTDPAEITKAKARAAFAATKRPVVVSDTSWSIPSLGGFPGGYMKDVSFWLQDQDWLTLMQRQKDRRIFCHEHIAFFDGKNIQHFMQEYEGKFATEARGRITKNESFERCVILYGGETMAEQLERGETASAGESLRHWQRFGEWYVAR